jgi:hypothetical protein
MPKPLTSFLKHFMCNIFRGKYSLGHAFWLVYILGNFIVGALIFLAVILLATLFHPTLATLNNALLLLFISLLPLPYLVISTLSVWRSSRRYSRYHLWANLSRFCVAAFLLLSLLNLAAHFARAVS